MVRGADEQLNRMAGVSPPGKTFTPKQGQYLAFIYAYTRLHRRPPAEADIQLYFRVSPPSAHQMILTLERAGLIRRQPRVARSIEMLEIRKVSRSYADLANRSEPRRRGASLERDRKLELSSVMMRSTSRPRLRKKRRALKRKLRDLDPPLPPPLGNGEHFSPTKSPIRPAAGTASPGKCGTTFAAWPRCR